MNVPNSVSHEQAVELLPWLVNNTLDAQEKEAVLSHAQACVICRRELTNLQQLQDSISLAPNASTIPEPDMRSINARIDAHIDRQGRGRELLSRFLGIFDSPLRIAFLTQTAVLLVLVTVLLWPAPESSEFTTLTQTEDLPDGRYVRVVFSPNYDQSEIAILLDQYQLTIVNGPSNRGVYTVAFADSIESSDAMISRLQDDPIVLFAQPVNVGAGR